VVFLVMQKVWYNKKINVEVGYGLRKTKNMPVL
jgi:hypothetical protein